MSPVARATSRLSLIVANALLATLAGGCWDDMATAGCQKVDEELLQVGANSSCSFRYGKGGSAKYVVFVTQEPDYGQASGRGEFLRYNAKPGFTGTDYLKIRIERRGAGRVQWQTLSVKVQVG